MPQYHKQKYLSNGPYCPKKLNVCSREISCKQGKDLRNIYIFLIKQCLFNCV